MKIEQIYLGGILKNFSYIIWCEKTKKGIVIDPGASTLFKKGKAKKILDIITAENLEIKYIINTHSHSDHTNMNKYVKNATGAEVMLHQLDIQKKDQIDIIISHEKIIEFGNEKVEILHTPGHTPGGICLLGEGNIFTGDTLFVGDSGTTALRGGDREKLGESLRKIMKYPDETIIWPGHNYGRTECSTIYREKRENINAKEYGFYVK